MFFHPRKPWLSAKRNEIRLFQVLLTPGGKEGFVHIKLHHMSLDRPCGFIAISWQHSIQGKPFPKDMHQADKKIICNNEPMEVSSQLRSVLETLQRCAHIDGPSALYWIDAIGFDPSDELEKSHQRSQMPQIFQLATKTICWLDTEQDVAMQSASILRRLMPLASSLDMWPGMEDEPRYIRAKERITLRQVVSYRSQFYDIMKGYEPYLESLGRLLETAWPKRLWVAKGIIHSRNPVLRCSFKDVPWDDLLWPQLCQVLHNHILYVCDPVFHAEAVNNILMTEDLRLKHFRKLPISQSGAIREPYDLAFATAFLSLRACAWGNISHASTVKVCASIVRHMPNFTERPSIWTLMNVINQHNQTPYHLSITRVFPEYRLPSDSGLKSISLPDFEIPYKRLVLNHKRSSFCASTLMAKQNNHGNLPPLNRFYGPTAGQYVDIIREVRSFLPPRRLTDQYGVHGDNLYCFLEWYNHAKAMSREEDIENGEMLCRFTETIQARGCGHIWEAERPQARQEIIRDAQGFIDFLRDETCPATDEIRFFYAACLPAHDRRFGFSSKGRFCLIPKEAAANDMICILYGNPVPIILRPQRDGYQNIGEAYVHGLMFGEVERNEQVEQMFKIT